VHNIKIIKIVISLLYLNTIKEMHSGDIKILIALSLLYLNTIKEMHSGDVKILIVLLWFIIVCYSSLFQYFFMRDFSCYKVLTAV